MTRTTCVGCGTPIPPSRGPGPARKWCSGRCRKQTLYGGTCVDCGAPTNGNGGPGKASERCPSCASAHRRIWTRDALLQAINAWADEHGGIPPATTDWNPALARANGRPEKAAKFYADNAWPHVFTVVREFGSWNNAIRAAGLEPRPAGYYGRAGEDPAVVAETVRLYREGHSLAQVGALMDCRAATVHGRLVKAGEPRRPAHPSSRRAAA